MTQLKKEDSFRTVYAKLAKAQLVLLQLSCTNPVILNLTSATRQDFVELLVLVGEKRE